MQKAVKVNETVYQKLQRALKSVNENGWAHMGSQRTDRPTMSSVIDEALSKLTNGKKKRHG